MYAPGWLLLILILLLVPVGALHLATGLLRAWPRWLTRMWLLGLVLTLLCSSIGESSDRSFPFSLIKGNGFEAVVNMIFVFTGQIKTTAVGDIIRHNAADFCWVLLLPAMPPMLLWLIGLPIRKRFAKTENSQDNSV